MTIITRNRKDVNQTWFRVWPDAPIIPAYPRQKNPYQKEWQLSAPSALWQRAKPGSNFAFRCGDGWVVFDADDEKTDGSLTRDFSNIPYVPVNTRDGCHFYVHTNPPKDLDRCWMPMADGLDGQVKIERSTVAAPGSTLANGFEYGFRGYSLVDGIRAVRDLPKVPWERFGPYLAEKPDPTIPDIPPFPRQPMPHRAGELFTLLSHAPKSQPTGGYKSRSEAELAVVVILLLSGWKVHEIKAQFDAWLPGHYREYKKQKARDAYFNQTCNYARRIVTDNPERQWIAERYQDVITWDWPGRSGGTNWAVAVAVLNLCYQFSTKEIDAPTRVLAERAAVSFKTAARALYRLQENGFLHMAPYNRPSDRGRTLVLLTRAAHDYPEINPARRAKRRQREHLLQTYGKLQNDKTDTKNTKQRENQEKIDIISPTWSWGKLGKSAGLIYSFLTAEPRTAKELALLSGKGVGTVRSACKRLAEYDLAKGTKTRPVLWTKGDRPLHSVGKELGADLLAAKRRKRHQRDRRKWQAKLAEWGRK